MMKILRIYLLLLFFVLTCSGLPASKKNNKDSMKVATKIIIDADAGVDDAFAIMLAHLKTIDNNNLQIVAITCVAGNTQLQNVIVNVLKTLHILNVDIPVYVGADRSLIITPETDFFYGQDGFGDVKFENPPSVEKAQKEHAVHALIRIVNENPGEITILSLGPLTNIALASRLDPKFRSNLKQLYVMGGSVKGVGNRSPGVEFNVFTDPEATFIVLNDTKSDQISPVVLLPWETVISNVIDMNWRKNVFGKINSPIIKFLNDIEAVSLNKSKTWVPSDGLLMAAYLNPSIISKFDRLHLTSVLQGELRGSLTVDWTNILGEYKNVIVIDRIDTDRFKQFLLSIFRRK